MTIKLKGSSDGSVSLSAPADTSPTGTDITLTLPTDAGSANQFIKNSGTAGTLDYSSMIEDSSGNVGINTSSPTSYGNSQATLVIEDDTNPAICWSDTGQTRDWWAVANGSNLSFNYADGGGSGSASNVTQVLSMASNGDVGIGTSSPTSELQVNGDSDTQIRVVCSSGGSAGIQFGDTGDVVRGGVNFDATGNNLTLRGYNNSERMRISSSGNIGIGSTNPVADLVVSNGGASGIELQPEITTNTNRITNFNRSSSTYNNFRLDAAQHEFRISGTERMRIDTSGNLLIGRTSVGATGNGHSIRRSDSAIFSRDATGETVQVCRNNSTGDLIQFRRNGTVCGEIVNNGSTSVAYNTSSDYRLKENVVEIADGIERIKGLKPSRFNFITEPGKTVDGFLAHEAQTVVPECATGVKDWVDEEGNPKMQGIDQSKLVPLLTAALQEAIAKIETLEEKVAALEAA